MSQTTITLEVSSPEQAALLRQFHGLLQEMQDLALTAPHGQVLHLCEAAVLKRGQEVNAQVLEHAVQQRIEALEKKGRRCVPAAVVADAKPWRWPTACPELRGPAAPETALVVQSLRLYRAGLRSG